MHRAWPTGLGYGAAALSYIEGGPETSHSYINYYIVYPHHTVGDKHPHYSRGVLTGVFVDMVGEKLGCALGVAGFYSLAVNHICQSSSDIPWPIGDIDRNLLSFLVLNFYPGYDISLYRLV